MGIEIEKTFFPAKPGEVRWQKHVKSHADITQGYIAQENGNTVRVRRSIFYRPDSEQIELTLYELCIKGPPIGLRTPEIEMPVNRERFNQLLSLCNERTLSKRRHYVPIDDMIFEVDEYEGRHYPLVTIDVELPSEETEFLPPIWLGPEITSKTYSNFDLARHGLPPSFYTWYNGGEAPTS